MRFGAGVVGGRLAEDGRTGPPSAAPSAEAPSADGTPSTTFDPSGHAGVPFCRRHYLALRFHRRTAFDTVDSEASMNRAIWTFR